MADLARSLAAASLKDWCGLAAFLLFAAGLLAAANALQTVIGG